MINQPPLRKFFALYNKHEKAKEAKTSLTQIKYANLKNVGEIELSFYRDNLLIYVITEKAPRAILIKNKEIVNSMKGYFHFLWKKS